MWQIILDASVSVLVGIVAVITIRRYIEERRSRHDRKVQKVRA